MWGNTSRHEASDEGGDFDGQLFKKAKKSSGKTYLAVHGGKYPGVYTRDEDMEGAYRYQPGAQQKGFDQFEEAVLFASVGYDARSRSEVHPTWSRSQVGVNHAQVTVPTGCDDHWAAKEHNAIARRGPFVLPVLPRASEGGVPRDLGASSAHPLPTEHMPSRLPRGDHPHAHKNECSIHI